MPIEIYNTSDIDDRGEVRTRPRVTPHPVVRPGDSVYISQPEHLAAMLHLQIFRTACPSSTAESKHTELQPESALEDEVDKEQLPSHLQLKVNQGQSKVKKKLLGKEFLDNQQKARLLLIEQSKKRQAKPITFNKAPVQEEIKRQEAILAGVLQEIKPSRNAKDLQRAKEKGVSIGIEGRSNAKDEVALGRSLGPMLTPKTREEAVKWAIKVSSQADAILERELYSVLVQVKKSLALHQTAAKASASSRYGSTRGRSGSKTEFLQSMLQDLQEPGEDDHLSLSEKLARQEKAGYSRFVSAIAPHTTGTHRLRKTVVNNFSHGHSHFNRKPTINGKMKGRTTPKLASTVDHAVQELGKGSNAVPRSPHARRPSSASLTSPRKMLRAPQNNGHEEARSLPRPHSSSAARQGRQGSSVDDANSNQKDNPPASRPTAPVKPSSRGPGFKFSRAARLIVQEVKDAKTPALAKVVPLVMAGPLAFNDAANVPAKMRSMSVMSVQINEHGEEEDVIQTKLCRVEGGAGGKDAKPQPAIIEECSEEDEGDSEEDLDDFEELSESTIELRHDIAPAIKRYSNNPDFQWNSKECYHYNEMFGVEEFHEHAVKHYEQLHQNREAAQQECRRVLAELAATSSSRIDKLLRRFIKHHELHDSLLNAMVQEVAQKDFHRPDVMKRLGDIINQKVHDGKLHGHVLDELRQINTLITYTMQTQRMNSLMKHKWFLKIIQNLNEYKKKMKTPVPKSLIRFLVASCKLLENKWNIDKELFYELLEELLDPADHKDVMVHRSLSIFREQVDISAEQFCEYLQQRQVHACPELLVEVRQLHMKRDRQQRLNMESGTRTRTHTLSTASVTAMTVTTPLPGTLPAEQIADGDSIAGGDNTDPGSDSDTEGGTNSPRAINAVAMAALTDYNAKHRRHLSNNNDNNNNISRVSESAPTSLFTHKSNNSGMPSAHLGIASARGGAVSRGGDR